MTSEIGTRHIDVISSKQHHHVVKRDGGKAHLFIRSPVALPFNKILHFSSDALVKQSLDLVLVTTLTTPRDPFCHVDVAGMSSTLR